MMPFRFNPGVSIRIPLEINVDSGAPGTLVQIQAQVLDCSSGKDVQLTGRATENDLAVKEHDVDKRPEELSLRSTGVRVTSDVFVAVSLMPKRSCHRVANLLQQFRNRRSRPGV